ncbi:MAG: hypothetical protein LBJ72_12450 [Dysgonamonadaceae bacterium]|jgi:hypothetical protein|nr:hypothetical protein [Dysgonamonadaceae bacterium]
MATTQILEYEMPEFLPGGWQMRVAKQMGWHRNTVYNIKKKGKSHPLYGKMEKALMETYGKPVKTETV